VISQSKMQELSASDALIRQWLLRFSIEHREDVAPRLPLWLEAFGAMDAAVLEKLFSRALKKCKFFPKVADILECVEDVKKKAGDEEAAQKWTAVLEHIRREWSPDIPSKRRISERTQRAINAAGGLAYIADCEPESKQWARKRFIEAYVSWGELQQDGYLLPPGEVRDLLAECAASKSVERLLETSKATKSAHVPNQPEILMSKAIPYPHSDKEADLESAERE
jgi:hypothetical protein